MPKKKSEAQAFVASGTGGMVPVEDHRFDDGPWAVSTEIPADQADIWMEYLQVECFDRGWPFHTFGQMAAEENSGSVSIQTGTAEQSSTIILIWERPRRGPLRLRARVDGEPQAPQDLASDLIARVNERFQARATQPFHRRGHLQYTG